MTADWVCLCALAVQDNAQLSDFRPHFQAVVEKLELLQQVLQLTPQPKNNQSSSNVPQVSMGGIVHPCLLLPHAQFKAVQ